MKHRTVQSGCCQVPGGASRNGANNGSASACCSPAASLAECCPQVQSIRARPLLENTQRRKLAQLFKILDNDTRLHILHVLIKFGELSVNDLADQLEMKPQAISNQLQKLAALQIVESRREGNLIFYRVVDPCVTMLLDLGLCLLESPPRREATKKKKPATRSKSF